MNEQYVLKPCPFCGGTDVVIVNLSGGIKWPTVEYAVRCRGCDAEKVVTRELGSVMEQAAAEAWNRRAEKSAEMGAPMFEYPKSLCPPWIAT